MSFLANYSKKYVKKKEKYFFFASVLLQKWYDLTWPYNIPKFNSYHLQK